jgi:SAM-dependent methyltransferase
MSLYGRYLLPRLLDAAMRAPQLADLRRRAAGAARGVVLELGFGTGRNLPFYDPARLERLLALEPDPRLVALARPRLASARFPVEVIEAGAEAIPLPDASVDTVLCTWTLCSIPRVEAALAESRRVLRADGRFLFAEHGLSPEPRVARLQRSVTPLWSRCAGGCRLDRRPDALLADAGFALEAVAARSLGRPKLLTWMTEGAARPAREPAARSG